MGIAQVGPRFERVPPVHRWGAELVVFDLTEQLVRRSHEARLFPSGAPLARATLVAGTTPVSEVEAVA